ncbi:uncharacterized protein LOC133520791 [Cydia pomonella]|uniref:uncharacterized protein LOC133520791 n=1 Tax=Cydia pomonella TaxID=82600 RepID=UPI002ADDF21D|nr:uncharacterized protein LOC133520791 [Cydia pomonella]
MVSINIFTFTLVLLIGFNHAEPTLEDWPADCKGKSYCRIQPSYYPQERFEEILKGQSFNFAQGVILVNNTSGDGEDVAGCDNQRSFGKIYLILDENDKIRFVAQNEDVFSIEIGVEECQDPGPYQSTALDESKQQDYPVSCHETKIPFMFPVLTLDGTALESVAPKDGLSVSCSAKIIEKN